MNHPDPKNDLKLKLIYNPSGSRRILTVDQGDEQAPKRRIVTVLSDPERYARTNPKDMVHRLSVSTEELRNGCVKSMLIERSVICGKCNGSGGTLESVLIDCTTCSGKGLCVKWEVGNPIKFNGCQSCDDCFGMGKRQQNLCWTCSGRRVIRTQKALCVNVSKGMVDGQRITFKGNGNEEPARQPLPPGDAIVVLDEIKDE